MTMTIQIRSQSHRRRIYGASWDPSQPTDDGLTPEHWYRSDGPLWQDAGTTPATADGDPVGRWEDKTGNADHINQNTAADKPTLQNGAADLLNGHPVLRFDGTNDHLQGAFSNGGAMSQPFTVFIVAQLDSSVVDDGVAAVLLDDSDPTNRVIIYKYEAPNPDAWTVYAQAVLTGNDANSDWNTWTCLLNGASSQFWHNGTSQASGNAGSNDLDGITVGDRQATGFPWTGDVAEIVIYSGDLSDATMNQINRYLAARYGLTYTDI